MSGIIKKIGKVFKKVIKLVKKVALPALAIGAVVLTGGAAIGALPSLSATIGSIGLSPGLTGAIVSAAKGATMGAVTSAVTGGDPIKGATTGLVAGGALGALTGATAGAVPAAGQTASGMGADSIISAASPMQGAAGALPATSQGIASGIAQTASAGGGLGGWLERNPLLAGSLIQGIGSGIMASQQAKDIRRQEERISRNYDGFVGADTSTVSDGGSIAIPKIERDPGTGRIVQKKG